MTYVLLSPHGKYLVLSRMGIVAIEVDTRGQASTYESLTVASCEAQSSVALRRLFPHVDVLDNDGPVLRVELA